MPDVARVARVARRAACRRARCRRRRRSTPPWRCSRALPAAAPTHPSPSASALASLSTNVGRPVSSARRERRGKDRHAAMLSGDTSSPPGLIGPPHPAPHTNRRSPVPTAPVTPCTSSGEIAPRGPRRPRALSSLGSAAAPVPPGIRREPRARRPSWCRRRRRRARGLPRERSARPGSGLRRQGAAAQPGPGDGPAAVLSPRVGGSGSGTSRGHRSRRSRSRSPPRPTSTPRPSSGSGRATRRAPCGAGCARTTPRRRT